VIEATSEERRPRWRKIVFSAALGAVFGFAGAAGVIAATEAGLLGEISTSQLVATLVALVYLLMGIAVGVGLLAPGVGASFLNVEDAEEINEQRASLVPSAIGCVLLALGLAALALSGRDMLLAPATGLAIFLATIAPGIWASLRAARAADELMRAMMRDSAAGSFYALFVILGAWAVLAHLGYMPAPAMLDIVTLMYALTLLVCFWIIGRRGMIR
jgi:hypothetical protein